MLIIIGLIVALIIGIALICFGDCDAFEIAGHLVSIIAIVLLLASLLFIIVNRYGVNAQIQAYHATVQTIEAARANGTDLEDAALQMKIIGINRELAKMQYYNQTIFNIWYPDEVMELELIK